MFLAGLSDPRAKLALANFLTRWLKGKCKVTIQGMTFGARIAAAPASAPSLPKTLN